jgi:hypothetical protein
LLQFGLDGISINFLFAIVLQFQLDVINLAYEQNISNIAIINFGYGQTNFKSPNCSKPFSLAASF